MCDNLNQNQKPKKTVIKVLSLNLNSKAHNCKPETTRPYSTHPPMRFTVRVTRIRALDPPPSASNVAGPRPAAPWPPPLLLVLLVGRVYFHPKSKENCIDIMVERIHIGPTRQYYREAKVEGLNLMPSEALTRPAYVSKGIFFFFGGGSRTGAQRGHVRKRVTPHHRAAAAEV